MSCLACCRCSHVLSPLPHSCLTLCSLPQESSPVLSSAAIVHSYLHRAQVSSRRVIVSSEPNASMDAGSSSPAETHRVRAHPPSFRYQEVFMRAENLPPNPLRLIELKSIFFFFLFFNQPGSHSSTSSFPTGSGFDISSLYQRLLALKKKTKQLNRLELGLCPLKHP